MYFFLFFLYIVTFFFLYMFLSFALPGSKSYGNRSPIHRRRRCKKVLRTPKGEALPIHRRRRCKKGAIDFFKCPGGAMQNLGAMLLLFYYVKQQKYSFHGCAKRNNCCASRNHASAKRLIILSRRDKIMV